MAKTKPEDTKYEYSYKSDYESDWDVHRNYIQTFDAYEAMLTSQVYDSVSNRADGSKITDSYTTTLSRDRADRVIAKLPDGLTEPIGKADVGKAAFMDILRQKWIYPNANAQRPFIEKLNLWQFYSSVYGYMPMFYDWTTSNTGYVGPDCWLWNPRNLVPQQGKVSIEDMDYVTALTWLNKKALQAILDKPNSKDPATAEAAKTDGYDRDAIQELINKVAEKSAGVDTVKDTMVERSRVPGGSKKGICLATRYESGPDGKWITFAPDNGNIQIRELDNPHKNGRIPFVVKYAQPLFDSFYGLGDFQRAKPLQFARDGLTNFYFASLKRNLSPGIIVNANGVLKHTLDVTAPNPVLMETIANSIRPMPTNTAGLSTYQGAMSNLTGSLLSLYGTQNASSPGAETLNPAQGKTPAAINMFSNIEATRDGAERRHLEVAIEQLTDGFFSLVVNIGTESIPVTLFADDIRDIVKSGMTDIKDLFKNFKQDATQSAGELKIDPAKLKGIEYRFNIAPDSTSKINKQEQLQEMETIMAAVGKFQNQFKDDPRVDVNWGTMLKAYEDLTSIPNATEFVTVKDGPTPQEQQMQQKMQELQAQQQTQITSPSGQVHESADLVKMFVATDDLGVKNAILQLLGLPPMQPPQAQPITTAGGVFTDPHVAAAAEHVAGLVPPSETPPLPPAPEPPPPPPEPQFVNGQSITDPHLAAASTHIAKL